MAISVNNSVIRAIEDNERGSNRGYGCVYTNIGGKCIDNDKIVP